jgi:hypothetical protein
MFTEVLIERREIFADGHEFPITGAYEKGSVKFMGKSIREAP